MKLNKKYLKILAIFTAVFGVFFVIILFWAIFVKVPDFQGFENRKVAQSTKIFDKTEKVILYDVYGEIKRTAIPFDEIPRNLKNATLAIEDDKFYQHGGISPFGIMRAFLKNLISGKIKQGGSTITQQLIKNSFLTPEQTIIRKLKEAILAIKVEKKYSKDEILNFYLNEIPYGSSNYGIESASESFFGKKAEKLTLAESAYLAALPKAPTYYSPYGERRDELEHRKNIVLQRMKELNYISENDYTQAKNEKVNFLNQKYQGIKAPHFVMFIRNELVKKYGEDMVQKGGLKVTTTLDYELQSKAEEIVANYAKENEKKFNAKNAGLVAIDPKTGQILVMVGSRDYFDVQNDGNFNVTTAKRQPGSSFKPFVYATAFEKGYSPDTVVFDLKTNFSVQGAKPYIPQNYDNIYRGPVTLRNALAQSINIPAVKVLYLSGMKNSLETAKSLGITTLSDSSRYGLTLVLGGGEVKLLEMTGAYAVFANNGAKNEITGILEVRDKNNQIIEKFKQKEKRVIDLNVSKIITDILSDNAARSPAFGENSYLNFPGKSVAAKTGTTNNYKDAWVIGYSKSFALGVWAGNNDNTPMEKKVAGFIAAPMWHAFFEEALKKFPSEEFEHPFYERPNKPALYGEWKGGKFYNGRLIQEVHNILYWVDKNNPKGDAPEHPENDSQFYNWEEPVRVWAVSQNLKDETEEDIKNSIGDDNKEENWPNIKFIEPEENKDFNSTDSVILKLEDNSHFTLKQIDLFFRNDYLGTLGGKEGEKNYEFMFKLSDLSDMEPKEKIKIKAYDIKGNSKEFEREININP